MTEPVDLKKLRAACERMINIIDEISNPATDSSGARRFGFPSAADAIRFELDGTERRDN